MTVQRYWEIILQKCADLDPGSVPAANAAPPGQKHWVYRRSATVHWIISEDNEERGSVAGAVVEANTLVTAEALYGKTHRLATSEEIQREIARREQMRREILAVDNAQRNQGMTVQVSVESLRAAIAAAGLAPKEGK